ncbi:NAD(P)/FAD-dependent oxidoreductase [Williamsia sp. D3]|uniref:NAD(P)/FAD-dependent oxidoreductase n=1 Tax=Williamsia sp. D3 TaxID=1313067 RepID=UPI0003D31241|nr:FAD-dependent oxidoreductase [Williamsia sp. D3]ETD32373.1 pyridine nucleotide-disulfide oxidoreductase [Williamsia sp. D3]
MNTEQHRSGPSGTEHDTDVLIVGASVAGVRVAQALRAREFSGRILLLDRENHDPYDKPPLSKEALRTGAGPTRLLGPDSDVDLMLDVDVTSIDLRTGTARLSDGRVLTATHIVLATGSDPRKLDTLDQAHPHYLRTIDEANRLKQALSRSHTVAVIGGGFIGLEVASTAHALGLSVTVIEGSTHLASRALPAGPAQLVADLHRRHGVDVWVQTTVAEVLPVDDSVRLRLSNDREITTDLVVAGVGARPRYPELIGTEFPSSRGVVCDHAMRIVGHKRMYAVGDVAGWLNPRYGRYMRLETWTSAREQAVVVANNIVAGEAVSVASVVPYVWSDQFGSRLQIVGDDDVSGAAVERTTTRGGGHLFTYTRRDQVVAAAGLDAQVDIARIRQQLVNQSVRHQY